MAVRPVVFIHMTIRSRGKNTRYPVPNTGQLVEEAKGWQEPCSLKQGRHSYEVHIEDLRNEPIERELLLDRL